MSWIKRPQGGTIPPVSEHQAHNTAQPYGNQQNMYPNYQGAPGVQPQQMWQMQQQYNQQQYGQVYQQQNYNNGANQFFQQPQQFNQNFNNQNYENVQQGYQQTYIPNQPQQQGFTQNEGSNEAWEDNWGWGWEDSSKHLPKPTHMLPLSNPQPPTQALVVDNANIIEESFAPSNNWSWSMEEKKENNEAASAGHDNNTYAKPTSESQNKKSVQNEPNVQFAPNHSTLENLKQDGQNLSDYEAIKDLPNLAIGKRFHLENLTPQWSIESQISQDSSDGPQTHSDGKYRSENPSRNSSKDSPGPNTDTSNFSYPQASNETGISNNERSTHSPDDLSISNSLPSNKRKDSQHDLLKSMQEISLHNHEVGLNKIHKAETDKIQKDALAPILNVTSSSTNSTKTEDLRPVPCASGQDGPLSTGTGALIPPTNNVVASLPPQLPPPSLSATVPLPTATMQQPPLKTVPSYQSTFQASQNPFKNAGSFSHKNIAKPTSSASMNPFPLQVSSASLTSPVVVNQFVQQDHLSGGYGVNLETTPDNSERPDQLPISGFRNLAITQQLPENLEVAPQNDRNEYLQTAHLSSSDFGENTDFSGNIQPPSGPRRMGVGQQDGEYGQNLNLSGDEPPPGLSRMVPGQQNESDNIYNQPSEDFMDRQIDGQPTDNTGRPYRQADGQQTSDDYNPPTSRSNDRRPIGLDRMVPGEPSNEEYNQYQSTNFAGTNEPRVVTGVDHDFPLPIDIGPSNVREQNLDGSDYFEPPSRNANRNIIGARDASSTTTPDFGVLLEDHQLQREGLMEGENLQDLNIAPSNETNLNICDPNKDVNNDRADSVEYPQSISRKHSLNRVTSGEDSERDRNYKASPRNDRDKHKSTRDHDRDKEGRYSRNDRKHERESDRRVGRDDRRLEKDRRDKDRDRDRRERDESPDVRRHRRSTRSRRYDTEDTDYYSDREKDRRRYREGSYSSSKPPRPDDKDRRYEDRDRSRRYNTIERDRRYDDERDGVSRNRRGDRQPDRFDRRYRDIDPSRRHPRREEEERRKVVTFCGDTKSPSSDDGDGAYSPGSRPGSREALATDEDGDQPRRRQRERRRPRDHHHHYDGYGAGGFADGYEAQRRQYEYYERLRRTDPAAYMRLYKQLMDPAYSKYYADGYGGMPSVGGLGYELRAEDRASVHSGRSSANGLKHTDTELTTDMSLNLQLEESTVRSERMTPFKYATSHVRGSVGAHSLVVVRAGGAGGTGVVLLPLHTVLQQRSDPASAELAAYPGPLVKGVTHKSRVMEYCAGRVRVAGAVGGADAVGYALVWQLLGLMLRQNGVVVGSDIAELLMNNAGEFENGRAGERELRRDSSASRAGHDDAASPPPEDARPPLMEQEKKSTVDEKTALDRLRELLIYGNRQEAIEWAVQCGLWGHALQLAGGRRERAAVAARFVSALPPTDPLHTLYHALAARAPPAATCVVDDKWGDWRPHAAIILANGSTRPDQDRRTLVQLGDSLGARGQPYSAQFCYLAAGERPTRHPLAPLQPAGDAPTSVPRLSLLLADPRARTLAQLATPQAIFATEVYEYALSLSQDFVLQELVVYKLMLSTRLVDAGLSERALAYAEQAARALTGSPHAHAPALAAAIAMLADRLKYEDPALQEEGGEGVEGEEGDGSAETSPRHQHQQWLRDVQQLAHTLEADTSQQTTPQHRVDAYPSHELRDPHDQHNQQGQNDTHYQWGEQQTGPMYPVPVEESPDYAAQYQQQPPPNVHPHAGYMDEWQRHEDTSQNHATTYWEPDDNYQHPEAESWAWQGAGVANTAEEVAPTITMPGAPPTRPALYNDYDDDHSHSAQQMDGDTDTPKSAKKGDARTGDGADRADAKGKGGWLGGILTKLALRAPNQMILPDDKNPTIVWDEQHKCWRDTAAPSQDTPSAPAAPPRLPAPAPAPQSTSTPLQSPAAPPTNLFQLQKGRNIKKAYVDVLGSGSRPALPTDVPPPLAPPLAPPTNYFVPAPAPMQRYKPVQVLISSSPEDSPRPISTLSSESDLYDPASVGGEFRSGI